MSDSTFSLAFVPASRGFGLRRLVAFGGRVIRALPDFDAHSAIEASLGLAALIGGAAFLVAAW